MTIYSFPSNFKNPATMTFSLVPNTYVFTSPLNKTTQSKELPGARWLCTMSWNDLEEIDARQLKAFVAKMRGQTGQCYMWDMSHESPSGIGTGSPLVKGASQTGTSLITDGWTINTTGILLAGDYFQVGTELKMLVADANSDGTGTATLVFEPALRASPADNAPLTIASPKCVMRLTNDEQDKFSLRSPILASVTLDFVEVFQ